MARHPKGMHMENIKAALRVEYGSLRALARTLGRSPSLISKVLTYPHYSIPTERLIAKALNKPLHHIWPERWTEKGESRPRSNTQNANEISSPHTSQKRRAA